MIHKILIPIFLLLTISVYAQNKYDAKGNRHGNWQGVYNDTKHIRYKGSFDHGKEKGIFTFYDNNSSNTIIAKRDFSAGNNTSYTTFYGEKGKKLSEGKEVNRLREGEWKFYHPDTDKIMSVELYKKGKLTGTKKVYFPNGTIAEKAEYNNGILNGAYKKFTEEGVVLEETIYKNGKLHGDAVFRNGAGDVVSKGLYENDLKTGIWKYYENGKLIKETDKTDLKIELERVRE